jgi:hypothetical protein
LHGRRPSFFRAYVPLTTRVASMPRLAGFTVPNNEQSSPVSGFGSARRSAQRPKPVRQVFAAGRLLICKIGPLLLAMCWLWPHCAERFRVNVNQPEAVRILERFLPASSNLGVIDGDDIPHLAPGRWSKGTPVAVGPLAIFV